MGQLEAKKQIVQELTEKFQNAQSVVVVDYTGVNAKQTTELRKSFRESNVEYLVAKNTLLKRAAEAAGYAELGDVFQGVTAVAFSAEDVVAPASIVSKFIKDNKVMEVKGGILEGEIISADKVKVVGELPSKEVLLSQVASCFLAPVQNVAYALEAIRKQAEEQEATA